MNAKKPGRIKSLVYKVLGVNDYVNGRVDSAVKEVVDNFGYSKSGESVTLESSLRVSAVLACVRLVAETISTLPIQVYRRESDGTKVVDRESQLYKILREEPNKTQTPSKMLEFLAVCLVIKGNAYFEKRMIGDRLISLRPILPQEFIRMERENGRLVYIFQGDNNEEKRIPKERIWHIKGFGVNGILGLDLFHVGRDIIGSAISSNEAAARFYEGGMSANGFLSVDEILTKEQRDGFQEHLAKYAGSKNAGKIMLLEAGMKYQGISIDPEKAQLLESRGYDVEEICRFLQTPPPLIGHMTKQSSWASSLTELKKWYFTFNILPKLVNIEETISHSLIAPEDRDKIFVKFNYEGFLRADSAERADYYQSALNNGWMSRNEVREKEDLPRIDGGDQYTVQSAMIPLEKVGENYEGTKDE